MTYYYFDCMFINTTYTTYLYISVTKGPPPPSSRSSAVFTNLPFTLKPLNFNEDNFMGKLKNVFFLFLNS